MPKEWTELKDSIIEIVRASSKSLLDEEPEVRALLSDRAERLGQILALYATAGSADVRAELLDDAAKVKQTVENEFSRIALRASAEARATFLAVVGAVFDTAIKVLPHVVGA
jgi:hypothetical protein